MYTSTNLGATWVIATNWVSTNFPNILGAVASSADGNRLVATPSNNGGSSKGWIYTSTDSGNTWVAATNGPNLPWQAVASSADGMRLVAIPSYGQIYTSSDAGKTWIMTMSPISGWSSIASSSDGTKLAALGGGYLYVSAPPSLGISRTGANTIVQWPSPSWSYALEQNSDLSTTNWSRVSGTAVDDGTTRSLEVNSSSNQLYFRLKL